MRMRQHMPIGEPKELVMLDGEAVMLTQPHTIRVDMPNAKIQGAFMLTNFRTVFTDNRTQQHLSVPLGLVERVEKEDGGLMMLCKDFRRYRFQFGKGTSANDQSSVSSVNSQWVDGLFSQLNRLAFPQDQSRTFAYTYREEQRPDSINGWHLYNPIAYYARLGLGDSGEREGSGIDENFRVCLVGVPFIQFSVVVF